MTWSQKLAVKWGLFTRVVYVLTTRPLSGYETEKERKTTGEPSYQFAHLIIQVQ